VPEVLLKKKGNINIHIMKEKPYENSNLMKNANGQ
jgi:hypothetical protein